MIPRDTHAVDAQAACQILGISYKSWHNTGGATRFELTPLNPGRRKPLYDQRQVEAARDHRAIPPLPSRPPHPDDLLDDLDIAEILAVQYVTVRKDRADGRLTGWIQVCGVHHLTRAKLASQIAARPGKGVGGGRPRKQAASPAE
ncbi:hypothetical protein [Nonomuraea soli]|uniref:Uncharacterized protein n=1 Tax=Nonomuraea soli TaxID=1032476 RepID=A0A7W0CVA0_9ACTN|nr:hypothetical protein [Nonomuraea soli]MBA2897764.1 hypothetical protein [Nonomuraea soli]